MERSRNKDVRSLGIEVGTSCTEGRALTNSALQSLLLKGGTKLVIH